ncbi:MAG: hypothetical protein ACI9PY_001484 [Ascidiaceihabitans sp.]|jgi:hypothetical protein
MRAKHVLDRLGMVIIDPRHLIGAWKIGVVYLAAAFCGTSAESVAAMQHSYFQ